MSVNNNLNNNDDTCNNTKYTYITNIIFYKYSIREKVYFYVLCTVTAMTCRVVFTCYHFSSVFLFHLNYETNFIHNFVLQVVNHVGRMSRGRRKLLLYGLVVGTLLLLAYKLRSCPEPEPQTMFMMPKDVSIPHVLLYHNIIRQ